MSLPSWTFLPTNKTHNTHYPLSPFFFIVLTIPWHYVFVCLLCLLLFRHQVVSDFVTPLQRTRLPCPSPSPGVCSNSCPLSQWCYPTISSSDTPCSSCPQSFPASGNLFQWVGSSHWVAKVLELQLQHQSFQWILGLSRVFSNTTVQNINSSVQWPILVNLLVFLILFSTWKISFLFNSILIDSKSHPVLFFISTSLRFCKSNH